ncbi:hypothetical protein H2200_008426 [Cladophialophora chaetospira]|uniref:Uncharacterized protein n=1 Tax=Cladophialophora chaetospira TaxID=386627 RepID=A0AA38X5R5_9EURO|nr:hypothetical protein H2200_008426 [Cladophialophora chaetospira]
MSTPFIFVNYDNPSQTKDRAKRQIISSHIGRFYRNRSGPSRRKENPTANNLAPEHDIDQLSAGTPAREGQAPGFPHHGLVVQGPRHRFVEQQRSPRPQEEVYRSPSPTYDLESLMPLLDYHLEQQKIREAEGNGGKPNESRLRSVWKPCPLTLVGQGRVDPFATYAVDEDYSQIHLGIDYGVQRFWPEVAPNRHSKTGNSSARAFLMQMKTSSLSYFSYLIAILTNYEWMHGENPRSKRHERLRLRSELALFRYIREALETLDGPPSDELIGAVLVLGSNPPGGVPSRKSSPPSRFHSPMADAQILDQYGAFIFPATHWKALLQLVRLRGGINKIENKDVAGGDLVESSKKSSPPDLEYCTIFGEDSIADSPEEVHVLLAGSNLSSSFLDPMLGVFESQGLHRTIRAVTQATFNLDTYLKNGSPSGDHPELLGLRNRAQWLSLNLQRPFSECDNEDTITNELQAVFAIIRTTLLIYNNLVLFPLPPVSGLDTRLALSLQMTIERALEEWPRIQKLYPKLLLWSFTLGGISDSKDLERSWFMEQFRKLLAEEFPYYQKWSQVEDCLTSCMWLDAVLNDQAINFWADNRSSGT